MSEPVPMPAPVQSAPVQPTTEAQRARVGRILDVATMLVTSGGEDALQMSELPKLAHVSLAALYRYFPSKQHLLFAVVENHLKSILARTQTVRHPGATVRERVAAHLLSGFHVDQRVPHLGRLVRRLGWLADPAFSAEQDRLARLHGEIMERAIGPMTDDQREIMWLVVDASDAAIRHWFAGTFPADEVRFRIRLACRLLDLPEEQVAIDRQAAERDAH